MLAVLVPPAYFTDFHLILLDRCRMVKIGMQHGMACFPHGFALLGTLSRPCLSSLQRGLSIRQARLRPRREARLHRHQAKVYYARESLPSGRSRSATAIDFMRATFRAAIETGDLTFACYGIQIVTGLLLRNDPLDAVWRESEMALDFAREAKYGDVADIILSQQRFIATMQGRTATFSTFSDAQFDEAAFEAQLTGDRMATVVCLYWILKLKARFLSGDYAEALAAADKAKPLLWPQPPRSNCSTTFTTPR